MVTGIVTMIVMEMAMVMAMVMLCLIVVPNGCTSIRTHSNIIISSILHYVTKKGVAEQGCLYSCIDIIFLTISITSTGKFLYIQPINLILFDKFFLFNFEFFQIVLVL